MLITIKVTYVLCSLSYILYKKLYIKFLALQDPTGTASASVHGKVLKDVEFGSLIEVGSVLVLKMYKCTKNIHFFYNSICDVIHTSSFVCFLG